MLECRPNIETGAGCKIERNAGSIDNGEETKGIKREL
jgi:hypothetical protein